MRNEAIAVRERGEWQARFRSAIVAFFLAKVFIPPRIRWYRILFIDGTYRRLKWQTFHWTARWSDRFWILRFHRCFQSKTFHGRHANVQRNAGSPIDFDFCIPLVRDYLRASALVASMLEFASSCFALLHSFWLFTRMQTWAKSWQSARLMPANARRIVLRLALSLSLSLVTTSIGIDISNVVT